MGREEEPAPDAAATLDPDDWEQFRVLGHRALDDMISFLKTVRERPVWSAPPAEVRRGFHQALPRSGRGLGDVLDDFDQSIKPYATGNLHPAFMGWVHGAGTPVGMIAEMLAAGLNANCGGRNHIGLDVEQQITRWMSEAFGFPDTATGLFVTGTSMANFLGVLIARNHALGTSVRRAGLGHQPQLCAYAAAGAHGCIAQAMEMAGIGSAYLRRVSTDDAGAMIVQALAEMVEADRRAGLRPFVVVGTAGSVDIGAIDPLADIAGFARRENLWFHVDGAYGALAALEPSLRPLLSGMEQADSIGFDFHKWGHVPYDAGFLLVRDGDAHKRSFASQNAYLSRATEGLAAGETWPCDLGPDLSRGFRALKTWFTFQVYGTERLGAAMAKSCGLARRLEALLIASPRFEVVAPVRLNIVCFTVRRPDAERDNRRIVEHLQLSGQAAPSMTMVNGRTVIRCAINNHRTTAADIDQLMLALDAAWDLTPTQTQSAVA